MDSYCGYNNVFSNTESNDLDKLARQINDERKNLNQQVQNNFQLKQQQTCQGLDCLFDPVNSRFAPSTLGSQFSFFSPQGDFSSGTPTGLKLPNQNKKTKKYKVQPEYASNYSFSPYSDSQSQNNDSSSNFSDIGSTYSFKSVSSNYSSLPSKMKKKLKVSSKHLQNFDSDDDTLDHLKKCEQCRNQLAAILQGEKNMKQSHVFNNIGSIVPQYKDASDNEGIIHINNPPNISHASDNTNKSGILFVTPELKDILILILIGIVIIISVGSIM